ncbi:MAG: regulatory protein RecX [Nitrososphaerales archaeon]
MAGHITSLEFQKHTDERVNVCVDGKYALALPALEAAQLKVGQLLTDADLARLRELDSTAKAYDRAVQYLSVRPRSTAEVRRRLQEAEVDEEAIEAAIARLTEQGYLNDAEFARYWVENRQRFRPKGEQALRQELRRAGVDSEAIDESLAGLDASEAAYAAARPRAERLQALAEEDQAAFRQKLGNFLLRRGFSYEVAREVTKRLLREMEEE